MTDTPHGKPALRITPPPKRYKIGELAAATGLTRQTLHNYTRWGLIREVAWTAGGHRLYDEAAFDRLARILQLKPTHTVERIRQILDRERNHDHANANVTDPTDEPDAAQSEHAA